MRILLLGGTDLTLAVAGQLQAIGMTPAGVVHVGKRFPISYSSGGVTNVRFADLGGWCRKAGVPHRKHDHNLAIASFARKVGAEFCLAAGWYHMVPSDLRARFALGTAGFHASLLPRLRGGAPLNWTILSGEKEAGMTLFALGDGVDDGPVYGQERMVVGPRTTIGELVQEAERKALILVEQCLPAIAAGRLTPRPQAGEATYCLQRVPDDGVINWRLPAVEIDRLVRAVGRPYPGACSRLDGKTIVVWDAEPLVAGPPVWGAPGQIARVPGVSDPCVVTGSGVLTIRDATDGSGRPILPVLRRAANRRFEMHV